MNRSKTYRRILTGILFTCGLLILIGLLGKVIYYFSSGAEEYQLAEFTPDEISNLSDYKWTDDITHEFGDLNIHHRDEIIKDYLTAWKLINNFPHTTNSEYLEDYFTDNAISLVEHSFSDTNTIRTNRVDINHEIYPYLFSKDQQVFAFTDRNIITKSKIVHTSDLLASETVTDTFTMDVVMILQDERWKIQNFETSTFLKPEVEQVQLNQAIYTVKENKFYQDEDEFIPRGVNYYPQNTPWFEFWKNYDPETTNTDFEKVNKLTLNTIRIFVPYTQFGKENINSSELDKLTSLLDIAEEHHIKVICTLFDFPEGFDFNIYNSTLKYVRAIVNKCKDHPALFAWDIKNEPDLDFEYHGRQKVIDWLNLINNEIKSIAAHNLVTIGWSSAKYAQILERELDFISFHYFKKVDKLSSVISDVKSITDKPIFVSEIGKSSKTRWFENQTIQKKYLNSSLNIMAENDVYWAVWTLYDYPNLPNSIFGRNPYLKRVESHYGLIDLNGNYKSSALLINNHIKQINNTNTIDLKQIMLILVILGVFIATLLKLSQIPKEKF